MRSLSRITADPGKIRQTSRKEYGVRFLFGGVVTAVVGIIGTLYGPIVAGLFLAFPAILPASLTLISQHDGERAAGVDAVGAEIGSFGLAAFGICIWALAARVPAWEVLLAAMVAWMVVSLAAWPIFDTTRRALRNVDRPSGQAIESDNPRWGVAKR